ncbi:unnamed protein product [Spirodela intermedia]|uniref:DUF4219 domain-containing protein n=1 Tax=Spirodela intermedia TaxID=51605 RepID=A0A7I8JGI0_SPIIN|nr:unnamed protein product [Spirodela intermedia]CAA6669257.1 unnamed protein product [Spirodela intermedia]
MHIGTFLILTRSNYQVWATRMRLHLEGLELWDVVEIENAPRKKDRQVMSIIFSTISDKSRGNWKLKSLHEKRGNYSRSKAEESGKSFHG